MQRVTEEHGKDEEHADDLDEALAGACVRLDDSHDCARCAPTLEIDERNRACGDDRLDGSNLTAIDYARRAQRQNQSLAVVGDEKRRDLAGAECLSGIGIGNSHVGAHGPRRETPDEEQGDRGDHERSAGPIANWAAFERDRGERA